MYARLQTRSVCIVLVSFIAIISTSHTFREVKPTVAHKGAVYTCVVININMIFSSSNLLNLFATSILYRVEYSGVVIINAPFFEEVLEGMAGSLLTIL